MQQITINHSKKNIENYHINPDMNTLFSYYDSDTFACKTYEVYNKRKYELPIYEGAY